MRINDKIETPQFTYEPNFIDEDFNELYKNIEHKCDHGSSTKRKSCVYMLHDMDLTFDYGYITTYPYNEVPNIIKSVRTKIEKYTQQIFDYVLVHIYKAGSNIAWHNDSEALNSIIASVSLGATRKFRLKEMGKKTGWDYEISLSDGDLIVMWGPNKTNNGIGCQQKYLHTVPVEKKVKDIRINLTFRQLEM